MKKLKIRMVYEIEGDTTIEVPDNLTLEEAIQYAHDYSAPIKLPEGKYVMGSERLVEEESWNFVPFKSADKLLASVEEEGLTGPKEASNREE
jgi:hypothetical protein